MKKTVLILKFILYVSTGLVLMGCAGRATQGEKPIATYPGWFWQSPNLSFPTAVGYSSIVPFHPDKAQKDAIDDGIERLTKFIHVRIHAERSTVNGQFTQKFQEEIDVRIKERVQNTYKLLATYHGDGLTIVLLGLGEATKGLGGATNLFVPVATASLLPNWYNGVDDLSPPQYVYGAGLNDMEYSSDEAWVTAERHARADLAFAIESHVLLIEGQHNSHTFTDVTLNDIETVARWYNTTTGTCFVFIRAPVPDHYPRTKE